MVQMLIQLVKVKRQGHGDCNVSAIGSTIRNCTIDGWYFYHENMVGFLSDPTGCQSRGIGGRISEIGQIRATTRQSLRSNA